MCGYWTLQKAVEQLELECALCLHHGYTMHVVVTGHVSVNVAKAHPVPNNILFLP